MHFGLFIFGLVTLGACYIWKKDTSSAYSRYYSHTKNLRSKYEDNIYESIWFRIDQSSTHNIIKNLFEKDIFGSMSKDESLELLHDIAEYQRLWDSYSWNERLRDWSWYVGCSLIILSILYIFF